MPESVGQPDVDEARACDVDADDVLAGTKCCGDGLGQRAGVLAGGFREHHGGVGGKIAVAGVARRLDRDAREIQRAAIRCLEAKALDGLDDPLVEIGEDVHVGLWKSAKAAESREIAAALAQIRRAVKQTPVLLERIGVGHAGEEIGDVARLDALLGAVEPLAPAFRHQAGIGEIGVEEFCHHPLGLGAHAHHLERAR